MPGVRVADEGDDGHARAAALAAIEFALDAHLLKVALELARAATDEAAVGLDLGLTGTAQADGALHPFEVAPLATQARQEVFGLRELDLQAPLPRARAHREDIEDEGGAVDHLELELLLQVALLRGRELVVEDDGVGALLDAGVGHLAGACRRRCRWRAGGDPGAER